MNAINIYCHRPIKNERYENKLDEYHYGCGFQVTIDKPEHLPSRCPSCFCNDLGIEKDYYYHEICKYWCKKKNWDSRSDTNIPRFLILCGGLNDYLIWRRSLTNFQGIFADLKPSPWIKDETLDYLYLSHCGFNFINSDIMHKFICLNPAIRTLCEQWRSYARKCLAVAA